MYEGRVPRGNIFVFFLRDTLKTTSQMRIQPIDAHRQNNFFQNQYTFCLFSKKKKKMGDLPPASSTPKLIYSLKSG